MVGEKETTVQDYVNQTVQGGDAPAQENRGAPGDQAVRSPQVDRRLVKAIVEEVAYRKRYVVPFTAVLNNLKGMAETDGEAYELGVELYRFLNEGAIKYAYLIGSKQSRVVVSPAELTREQLSVLREVGRLYNSSCVGCSKTASKKIVDVVIDGLVSVFTSRENLVSTPALAAYVLARNHGLKIGFITNEKQIFWYGSKLLRAVETIRIEGAGVIIHYASDGPDAIELWNFGDSHE
jgi:hypothetical protein